MLNHNDLLTFVQVLLQLCKSQKELKIILPMGGCLGRELALF